MTPHHTHQPSTYLGTQKPGEKMSINPKIYTAAEVQCVGINEEEINQALATITQKAYEAAKDGKIQLSHRGTNLNSLSEIAHRLRELGYDTEIYETAINEHSIIVFWGDR